MKTLFYCVCVCISLSILSAQPRGFQRPHAMERLESYKKIRMLETMKLEEQVGLKLINRYNKHRETLKALEGERSGLVDTLESQLRENASDAEFQQTFNALIDVDTKITDSRAKYLSELKEILTTKQIAQYIIFERNFARDLRDIMRDSGRDRMRH